jgi:hypothetical protein
MLELHLVVGSLERVDREPCAGRRMRDPHPTVRGVQLAFGGVDALATSTSNSSFRIGFVSFTERMLSPIARLAVDHRQTSAVSYLARESCPGPRVVRRKSAA